MSDLLPDHLLWTRKEKNTTPAFFYLARIRAEAYIYTLYVAKNDIMAA